MKLSPPFAGTSLLAYTTRGRGAWACLLCSLMAWAAALGTLHSHLANHPLYAVCAPAFVCGVFAFLAFDAATLAPRRWTYAAACAAFAAVVAAAAPLTASLLRVFPPPA